MKNKQFTQVLNNAEKAQLEHIEWLCGYAEYCIKTMVEEGENYDAQRKI